MSGKAHWPGELEEARAAVALATREGCSAAAIAGALGLSERQVCRIRSRLRAEGRLGWWREGMTLTAESVVAMREFYRRGASVRDVAERFNVSTNCAGNAVSGRSWKHVPGAARMRPARRPRRWAA